MSSNLKSSNLQIRPAIPQDAAAIMQLGSAVNEFQVSEEVVTFWPKKIIDDIIQSKTNPILVAEMNDEIVGFVIANYNETFKKAIIENLFVKKELRGQNASDLLVNSLLNRLKTLGCQYVCTLIESSSLNAIKAYQRFGFNRGIDCVWLDTILDNNFSRPNTDQQK